MEAQKLIDVVEREMEKKYDPDQQLCELVLKEHPELKKYIKTK